MIKEHIFTIMTCLTSITVFGSIVLVYFDYQLIGFIVGLSIFAIYLFSLFLIPLDLRGLPQQTFQKVDEK